MKKCKLAAMAWLSVCIVLFTSCGNSAGVSASSTSEVKSTAVSESTAEEKQPYEILREKEDETKQIAADEEQQTKELQDALSEFEFLYTEFEGGDALMGVSLHCDKVAEKGESCILPVLYIFGPSMPPYLCVGFNYIGDEYLDMDTVEIDTDNYRYTYDSESFMQEVQKTTAEVNDGKEKADELALRLVTEDDIDNLADIIKSDKVQLTFAKYNTAKPVFVECEMPDEDRHAITDALNAYYLYLNASERVRAKALADISYTEVES
ncbi:hypothetical protein [Faecalibacterium langellae]|uniref:Uncharacterized protein n=1 Tax=Faecalibacterium langellae TaxID=3435293 RepID=A0ACC9D0P0_9FIRM|nr:hypothetical protein [Faecalibacterium prausnitzii]PDX61478.1 hypothetical protein CGS49_05630 [Faecalibacterium prausnitzii]